MKPVQDLFSCPTTLAKPALRLLVSVLIAASGISASAAGDPRASKFYEDALQRFDKKDNAGAIVQLKNALQADKNMLPVHVLLGKALIESKDFAAAEASFEEALRLGVNRAEIVVPLAKVKLALAKGGQVLEMPLFADQGLPPETLFELLLLKAGAADSAGDRKQTTRYLDGARALKPSSPDTWMAEASLLLRSGKFAESKAAADRAVAQAPKHAQALYVRGTVSHAQGDISTALSYYIRALESDPKHLDSMVTRAGVLLDLNRTADAKRDVEEALRLTPKEPRALYLKALIAERNGNTAEAKAALAEAATLLAPAPIEFLRQHPHLLMVAGLSNFSLGQMEKAKPYLEAYLRDQPGSPAAKVLARIHVQAGEANRATEVLDAFVQRNPRDVQAVLLLASAHASQGRTTRAVSILQAAAQADDRPEYRTALGVVRFQSGQVRQAIVDLQSAYKHDPSQLSSAIALASIYLQSRQPNKSLEIIEPLLKKQQANAGLHLLAGRARLESGDLKGGQAALERAITLEPRLLDAKVELARLSVRQGSFAKAQDQLGEVLKVDLKHMGALTLLAEIEERSGRLDEAEKLYEKADDLSGPTALDTGIRLIEFHLAHGHPDRAVESLKRITTKAPEAMRVLIAQGRVELASGSVQQARSTLTRASSAATSEPDVLARIAELQVMAGDAPGAAYTAAKALSETPSHAGAAVALARAELLRGNLVAAEQVAKDLAVRQPKLGIGPALMGDVATARNEGSKAIESYRRAHQIDRNSASALRLFGAMARFQSSDATKFAEQWVKSNPQDQAMWKALADALARRGSWPAAKLAYETLLKLNSKDADAANNLANVLLIMKDPAALRVAEQALSLKPDAAHILSTVGWAAQQAGQSDRALQLLRDARLRNPASGDTRYYLAAVLTSVGRKAEARTELEAALNLGHDFQHLQDAKRLMASLN